MTTENEDPLDGIDQDEDASPGDGKAPWKPKLTPGQQQMLMGRMDGAGGDREYFNLTKQLLEGSTQAEQFLARADLTEKDLSLLKRLTVEMNEAEIGHTDEPHLMWVWLTATVAVGRESRREAVQVATSLQVDRMNMRRQGLDRLNNYDNSSSNGNRELG